MSSKMIQTCCSPDAVVNDVTESSPTLLSENLNITLNVVHMEIDDIRRLNC